MAEDNDQREVRDRLIKLEERQRVLTEKIDSIDRKLWAVTLAVLLAVAKNLLGLIGL